MGMPQLPDDSNRPDLDEVFIDLFESIALEEIAISSILNAEADKLQALVKSFKENPTDIRALDKVSSNLNQTISNLIIKEWLLLSKFNNIKDYSMQVQKLKKTTPCNNCSHNKHKNYN